MRVEGGNPNLIGSESRYYNPGLGGIGFGEGNGIGIGAGLGYPEGLRGEGLGGLGGLGGYGEGLGGLEGGLGGFGEGLGGFGREGREGRERGCKFALIINVADVQPADTL